MDYNLFIDRQLATVAHLLKIYDGTEPLHLYLKKYFAANKKHGSRDRKVITQLCYSYFRLGENAVSLQKQPPGCTLTEVLRIGAALAGLLALPAPGEGPADADPQVQRFNLLQQHYPQLRQELLFPSTVPVSGGLDLPEFRLSMLRQPDVFIRIRPDKHNEHKVLQLLKTAQIRHRILGEVTVALAANTPIDKQFKVNTEVVVQDISSQHMGRLMQTAFLAMRPAAPQSSRRLKIWDCCAASGGKSLLACDLAKSLGQTVDLTVSDIRDTILKNLDRRFTEAGITGYKKQVLDLLSPAPLPFNGFDLVICDAPCTGSGTWARTPEQITFFNEDQVPYFYDRQIRIASKAGEQVRPGGYFLYMTCSVFRQENEAVVEYLSANSGMELIDTLLFAGYPYLGDSMFGALFTRKK